MVTVGGGSDGHDPIEAVLDADQYETLPYPIVIVTGPLMSARSIARLLDRCDGDHVRLFDFRHDMANVLAGARGVVTMGGYNTISEVLQTGVPALVIPRVRPSEEQLIRAEQLVELGLADMLHPDLVAPERMWKAIERTMARPRRPIDSADYRGAERTAELLVELAKQRRKPFLAAS